jgi:riboflavin kinase/FMN adenylyltransferase
VSPPPGRLVPAGGIYACLAQTQGLGTYQTVVNIGTRPTFVVTPGEQAMVTEAHLLDLDADLYGQELALDFVARLRDERTFSTPGALVAQIRDDIAQARAILTLTPSPSPYEGEGK